MSRPRDTRTTIDAATRYAIEHALNVNDRAALLARVGAMAEWVLQLRAVVSAARRASASSMGQRPSMRELRDTAAACARTHGPMVIRLMPGQCATAEGIPLPGSAELDADIDLFAALHDAGVDTITLNERVSLATVQTLVDVLAEPPGVHREDPYIRVWLARGPGLALGHTSCISPASLAMRAALFGREIGIHAALSAFEAAAPDAAPRDPRTHFTANTLVALAPHGVDPDAAREVLLAEDGGALPRASTAGAAAIRTLAEQDGDIETRVSAARSRHLRGGA